MNKINGGCLIILLFFTLIGCVTQPSEPAESPLDEYTTPGIADFTRPELAAYWDTWSSDGVPLFFGTSRRMRDRDEEWGAALLNAAQQAVRYHQVSGLSRFMTENTSKGSGHLGNFQFQWDSSKEVPMLEKLEILKRARDNDGSYLLVRYADGPFQKLPSQGAVGAGRPGWLTVVPAIPGYRVSLGSTQRKRSPVDSISAADEQALEEMIKQLGLEFSTQRNTIDFGNQGVGTVQSSMEIAQATVRGFSVIARWYEPGRGVFYSLGICPADLNN